MIINTVRQVRVADPSEFAWSGLRKFQNVDLVTERLVQLHGLEGKAIQNAKKQALQLRYCLIQAQEYFTAAKSVSLATKPNLLYYGIMSLALAEILFKQTGESSLDYARAEHGHHGLTMSVGSTKATQSFHDAARQIRAVPVSIGGRRKGTFSLWHKSQRELPVAGKLTSYLATGGSTSTIAPVLRAADVMLPEIPDSGITFFECYASCPWLLEGVILAGANPNLVRGTCNAEQWPGEDWRHVTTIILHPNLHNKSILDNMLLPASHVNTIEIQEISDGYHIRLTSDPLHGGTSFPLPIAGMIHSEEFRMAISNVSLNEFGTFYLGLFLAGNYARYYPDMWLRDVERSAPLASAIEDMCSAAEWRTPWLTLCELSRVLYVNEP